MRRYPWGVCEVLAEGDTLALRQLLESGFQALKDATSRRYFAYRTKRLLPPGERAAPVGAAAGGAAGPDVGAGTAGGSRWPRARRNGRRSCGAWARRRGDTYPGVVMLLLLALGAWNMGVNLWLSGRMPGVSAPMPMPGTHTCNASTTLAPGSAPAGAACPAHTASSSPCSAPEPGNRSEGPPILRPPPPQASVHAGSTAVNKRGSAAVQPVAGAASAAVEPSPAPGASWQKYPGLLDLESRWAELSMFSCQGRSKNAPRMHPKETCAPCLTPPVVLHGTPTAASIGGCLVWRLVTVA